MNTPLRPAGAGAPSANYELGILSSAAPGGATRHLFTSGIGPTRPDGSVPDEVADQADVVWHTLSLLLGEAGMKPTDVVQVSTFVVDPGRSGTENDDCLSSRLAAAMAARDRAMGPHQCASVLVPVPALATETWKLEVALVAFSSV